MGNMKALVAVVLASLFVVAPVSAIAAEKIAFVDLRQAIMGSNAAQKMQKELIESSTFVGLKAKFEGSAADYQALAKEMEAKRLTWSQEQALEHRKKMEYAKADAELAKQKIEAEGKQLEQKILQALAPKAQKALADIYEEEGITLLLRQDVVMNGSPELSLTAKVADRLNQKTD